MHFGGVRGWATKRIRLPPVGRRRGLRLGSGSGTRPARSRIGPNPDPDPLPLPLRLQAAYRPGAVNAFRGCAGVGNETNAPPTPPPPSSLLEVPLRELDERRPVRARRVAAGVLAEGHVAVDQGRLLRR